MIASYLSETSLHRSPFFSITVSWFSSLEDRYPMRCIPIRPAPTISVLKAGWSDRVISFRSRKGVENNPHAHAPPKIRLKQTLFANRSSISPMSKGCGKQTGKQGHSSDSSPNEGYSGRIHALFLRFSLKHEGAC